MTLPLDQGQLDVRLDGHARHVRQDAEDLLLVVAFGLAFDVRRTARPCSPSPPSRPPWKLRLFLMSVTVTSSGFMPEIAPATRLRMAAACSAANSLPGMGATLTDAVLSVLPWKPRSVLHWYITDARWMFFISPTMMREFASPGVVIAFLALLGAGEDAFALEGVFHRLAPLRRQGVGVGQRGHVLRLLAGGDADAIALDRVAQTRRAQGGLHVLELGGRNGSPPNRYSSDPDPGT